jgi:aspartyl-tRNA(Asn)/glutamyl-tRNA(Gln) amidotransferase subunit B
MYRTGKPAAEIVKEKGLTQISDHSTLERLIDEVLEKNPAQVAEYRGGKEKVFGFLVGQAMKATRGQGNPALVNELLKKKLG